MHLVLFPKNPYLGQIYYDLATQRTFEFIERFNGKDDFCSWIDITEKDLVP